MISELNAAMSTMQRSHGAQTPLGVEPGMPNRPAASVLDLGSNSVKISHYTVDIHNDFKLYYQRSVRLKLFEGLKDGKMKSEYVDRMIDTLRLFREKIDFEDIKYVVAVATSAVRDAENRAEVVRRIRDEAKLDFKILSDSDEAHYSYAGAIRMLHIPSVLFFDIGGGSLEVVVAKNYRVKSASSFPLGALRLTRKFAKDPAYDEVDFASMARYVERTLPNFGDIGAKPGDISPAGGAPDDPTDGGGAGAAGGYDSRAFAVVGVGGSLRTLAKYAQDVKKYPFSKTHNYQLAASDLEEIWEKIRDMPPEKIAHIPSINSSRADTIRAALLVVLMFLKRTGSSHLTVSAHGLREGALALSMQHPDAFASQRIDARHIRETVLGAVSRSATQVSSKVDKLVDMLLSANLLRAADRPVIRYALEQTDRLRSFRDVSNILYMIMDDDTYLGHSDQLFAALAVMHTRKRRKADAGLISYESVSGPYDKKWVRRISAIIMTYVILNKADARMTPAPGTGGSIMLAVEPAPGKFFPKMMFEEACGHLANSFGVPFEYKIRRGAGA